jgi:hypothetical protein
VEDSEDQPLSALTVDHGQVLALDQTWGRSNRRCYLILLLLSATPVNQYKAYWWSALDASPWLT